MSIQSVKAIEVDGIESSKNYGTSVQDQYVLDEKEIKIKQPWRFEGGMTNGKYRINSLFETNKYYIVSIKV